MFCHHEENLGEAIGKSAAQLQQKTLEFWRCKKHVTTTKNSNSRGEEPEESRAREVTQAICRMVSKSQTLDVAISIMSE